MKKPVEKIDKPEITEKVEVDLAKIDKVYGLKKPKVFVREPVEIPEDVSLIDWGALSNQMSFIEYHELRKKHGLE